MEKLKYTSGAAFEVVDKSGTHALYPTFLMQIFEEYDGENINLLAYRYGVSERTMGRLLKSSYLYIRNERKDIVDSLDKAGKEKLIDMSRWDSVRYVSSDLEKKVRKYLRHADMKKADLTIKDLKTYGTVEISLKKR